MLLWDAKFVFLSCVGIFLFFLMKREKQPGNFATLLFSDLNYFPRDIQGKARWLFLPKWLMNAAFVFFAIALMNPRWLLEDKKSEVIRQPPREGQALYLVLDRSGSMAEPESTGFRWTDDVEQSKIDVLKDVIINDFLSKRSSDLIGAVVFARFPIVLSPLTFEYDFLKRQLESLDVVKNREDDGTAIGYAIYKTASLIAATKKAQEMEKKAPYQMKGAAMIVVTDGFQDPNPLDQGNRLRNISLEQAAEFAKEKGVKIYLISIGKQLSQPEFAPHRRILENVSQMTGGEFFQSDNRADLQKIYAKIDAMEKSQLALPAIKVSYLTFFLFPYLIAAGMLCVTLAVLMNHLYLKPFP